MEKSFSVWSTCCDELSKEFLREFKTAPVVLCVGSSLYSEDFLGPMVGSILKNSGYKNYVYGSLDAQICATNLQLGFDFVKSLHPDKKILVVDASTSKLPERLGQIVLKKDYVPFNPNLKEADLKANWFLFGVCSVCENTFPQMFYAKSLLSQKVANLIAQSLLALPS